MKKEDCLKALKARLNSNGKTKSSDAFGNVIYIDCDIYSVDVLETFLDMSLSEFNQMPVFTNYTYDNEKFVETFMEVLVEGATLYALSSQALIERGREFQIEDNGVFLDPPNVAEMLATQYKLLLVYHFEKLKLIKNQIRDF